MGEGSGREPGRQFARPNVPAQAAGKEPRRTECVAGRSVHRLRTADPASRVQGADNLGGVPGGTHEPDGVARPLRRVRREGGASTTCLIMADHNRYSVDARAAGRMVLVRSHAERIVVLLGDEAVADHPRNFRRDQIIYDPWHYLPVLMKKPGALRNGAPFKDWELPPG